MNTQTLTKVNRFGKIGKIVMTVLLIIAIIAALLCSVAAICVGGLPKDAITATVTSNAELRINEENFASVWDLLVDGFVYEAGQDPSNMLADGENQILPPEDTEINTHLEFLQQSYASATVRSEGGKKIVDAKSAPSEYTSSDLAIVFIFAALVAAFSSVALFMLQRLFKVLSLCESPFCTDFVSKLRAFGYSLLPVAVFASIGETLAVGFLTIGKNAGPSIQWGMLIAFAVTMFLVTVFRYGVQLQKESDETL